MGDLSKYFDRSEFACKCGCGFDSINPSLVGILNEIREEMQTPLKIHSGCR